MKKSVYPVLILSMLLTAFSANAAVPSDSKRMRIMDVLYKMFESPFGIDQFAYQEYVDEQNNDGILEALKNAGANDPTVISSPWDDELLVSIPLNDSSFIKDTLLLNPVRVQLYVSHDTIGLDYFFPAKETPEKEIKRIVDLLKDTGCAYTWSSESGFSNEVKAGKDPIYYKDHVYEVYQSGDDEIVMSGKQAPRGNRWYMIPAGYVPGKSFKNFPANAPCNKGGESFNSFLNKFNIDKKFRQERCNAFTATSHWEMKKFGLPSDYYFIEFNKMVVNALSECGLLPLMGLTLSCGKYDNGEKIYDIAGLWYYPSSERVIYNGWNVRGLDEYASNGIILLFERVDGKWYCTNTYFFGSMMDDAVKKQYTIQ